MPLPFLHVSHAPTWRPFGTPGCAMQDMRVGSRHILAFFCAKVPDKVLEMDL
jgi:hypothetical protein